MADEYDESLKLNAVFHMVLDTQELLNAGIAREEAVYRDFKLISNYITINTANELVAINDFDRDSFQFSSVNGVLILWAKVFLKINPINSNYFKVKNSLL